MLGSTHIINNGQLTFKYNGQILNLPLRDILYVEAMRNYVLFFTSEKKFIHYSSFKNIDYLLKDFGFVKVQKSFIVNPKKVTNCNNAHVFINDVRIPVSRENRSNILESVKNKIESFAAC